MKARHSSIFFTVVVIFISLLIFQTYFVKRPEFGVYLLNYTIMFTCFLFLLSRYKIKDLLYLSLLLHLCTFFAIPELSNDFYRFIWDGDLLVRGINPYLYQPQELIHTKLFSTSYFQEVYSKMGTLSNEAYSPYPVINQLFFAIPSFFSSTILGHVIGLRIIILLGELVIVYYGIKILELLGKNTRWIVVFTLNPFVILEFTANLHFEVWMLAFFLASYYYILKNKLVLASFLNAFSIQTKLITLLFLPFYWRNQAKKTSILFYTFSLVFTLLIGLFLFNTNTLTHFLSTIQLYFNKFEFNGGFYFFVREVAYKFRGYNEIAIIGKCFSVFVFCSVLFLALRKKIALKSSAFFYQLFFASMIYLTCSTTVHPWYVLTPFLLSIFAGNFIGLVWTFLIALSYYFYAVDYTSITYSLVGLEWSGVFVSWILFRRFPSINQKLINLFIEAPSH